MGKEEADIPAEISEIKGKLEREQQFRDSVGSSQSPIEELRSAVKNKRLGIVARSESLITEDEISILTEKIDLVRGWVLAYGQASEDKFEKGVDIGNLNVSTSISKRQIYGVEPHKLYIHADIEEGEVIIVFGFEEGYLIEINFFEPKSGDRLVYGGLVPNMYPLKSMTKEEYSIASFYIDQLWNKS